MTIPSCLKTIVGAVVKGGVVSLLALGAASAHAGVDYGHGGNLIVCRDEASGQEIYQSLDFALTRGDGSDDVAVTYWFYDLTRIQAQLAVKAPSLGASLADYLAYAQNFYDPAQARVWRKMHVALADHTVDGALDGVPEACLDPVTHRPRLVQGVIRDKVGARLVYEYRDDLFDTLNNQQLQLSYLLLHEWLWDVVGDFPTLRRINRLLHSQELLEMPADVLAKRLADLGLPASWPSPYRADAGRLTVGVYMPTTGGAYRYVRPVYEGPVLVGIDAYAVKSSLGGVPECYLPAPSLRWSLTCDGTRCADGSGTDKFLQVTGQTSFETTFTGAGTVDDYEILSAQVDGGVLDECLSKP